MTRKIVAIRFDDGAEAAVPDLLTLRGYIDSLLLKEEMRALASAPIDWPLRAKLAEARQVHKLGKKATNRRNATISRNSFSRQPDAKKQLLAFKDAYEADHGKTHGWITAACAKFPTDPKTLKRILGKAD